MAVNGDLAQVFSGGLHTQSSPKYAAIIESGLFVLDPTAESIMHDSALSRQWIQRRRVQSRIGSVIKVRLFHTENAAQNLQMLTSGCDRVPTKRRH